MITILQVLDSKTDQLLALLSNKLPHEEERDAYIEKVNELLAERDELIKQLQPPFSPDELQLGRIVTEKGKQISPKLSSFQKLMKTEFAKVQQSKKTVRAYEQAYTGVSADGMYYDKRN